MLAEKLSGAVGNGSLPTYIEDVFSTYLYTGNGANRSIDNGIDLSTKGGMTWFKCRNVGGIDNLLFDTSRGVGNFIRSNTTGAQVTASDTLTSFNTNGFSLGVDSNDWGTNFSSTRNYASWTFRKQPKFFDVVTYTGNGAAGRSIAHSLGSVPGCILVKNTSAVSDWTVYHRSTGNTNYLSLNATDGSTAGSFWGSTTPTSTAFTVSASGGHQVNFNGESYVAYIFAHDAGGFGLTGTDNVISCGSFTTDGSGNATITLGYEPQWFLYKSSSNSGDWTILDTMRGFSQTQYNKLYPNYNLAESVNNSNGVFPTATGIQSNAGINGNQTYIYIAIRRGPMKVPTDATKVFKPVTYTGTSATRTITGVGFPLDMNITMDRATHTYNVLSDRLRGLTCDGSATQPQLRTNATDAEASIANGLNGTSSSAMDGYTLYGAYSQMNASPDTYVSYNYSRAPSFFDEVCATSNASGVLSINHNLTVTPELAIIKDRQNTASWYVVRPSTSAYLLLNSTAAQGGNLTLSWSATTFSNDGNYSNANQVVYLFATCAGVSKVGSYTGNGSSQTIACGFAAGARFVMIKRTDSTGDWYVWDTARGIVSGNDPHLSLNTTAAEVTSDDTIDTDSTGFVVNQLSATNVNVSSATYIFLAIA